MLDDAEQPSRPIEDDVLDGDLELEAQDAEQVTGGTMVYCSACRHHHGQLDPKCTSFCMHGARGGAGAGRSGY
jgi:hypothetical protein